MGALFYDTGSGEFDVAPDFCPVCDDGDQDIENARNDTGCDAPGCQGYSYDCCGRGCGWGWPDSRCQAAAASESSEAREDRINRERAAFGLSSLSGEGEK